MRKYVGLALAASLFLSACGNGATKETENQTTEAVNIELSTQAEESTGAEETEPSEEMELPEQEPLSQSPLVIGLSAEYEGEWDDKGPIITADSSKIQLFNDGYDALKDVVEAYNERNWQEVYSVYNEHLEYVKDGIYPEGTEISISRKIEITRADSRILSFVNEETAYLGGAHGSYYENGEVYDAESGEALELTDVVTDLDAVYKYVRGSLRENYEKESFFEGYEEWLEEMFYEPDGAMASPLEWVMTTEGLEFRFSPYVLGPWVSGMFEVELPYEGNEELFAEEYCFDAAYPIRKIEQNEVILSDMNGDGEEDKTSYSVAYDPDTYFSTLVVSRESENGEVTEVNKDEIYGTFTDAYLMHTKEGVPYLYVEFLMDNDWRKLEIVCLADTEDASGPVFAGGSGVSVYGHFISDSEQFTLYDRLDILGTYMAYKTYYVGEDGMPAATDEQYTFVNPHFEWDHALTAKREIPVQMHVEGSEERIEEKLPKGTKFRPRKTDGKTVIEMELEDGSRCDILVERKPDEYVYYINGISEYEYFGDVPYAG